jgi:hypothetical protein
MLPAWPEDDSGWRSNRNERAGMALPLAMQPDTPTPDLPQPDNPQPDNPMPRPPSNPDPDVPTPQVPDGDPPPPMPGPPEGDPPARDPTQPQELPGTPSRPVVEPPDSPNRGTPGR